LIRCCLEFDFYDYFQAQLYPIYLGAILPGIMVYYPDLDRVLQQLCLYLTDRFYCWVGLLCATDYGAANRCFLLTWLVSDGASFVISPDSSWNVCDPFLPIFYPLFAD
jgi:hypothetical protein